jgi:phospholipid/cholesterol/gamma-HCH transport system substrate-binding protein
MSGKPNDFKLGLFVLAGLVILLGGVFILGGSKVFQRKTVEETYVTESVQGLKVGAPVLLRGVPVGEVTRINFSWNIYRVAGPRYVVVDFEVENKVAMVPPGKGYARRLAQEIAKGLRARVKSQGLAGATILSLEYVKNPAEYPPLPFPWKPRHFYIPSAPGQFSQILDSLNSIAANLKQVNFQRLTAQVQEDLATLQRTIQHVDQLDVAALGTNLNGLLTELRGVTAGLRSFVGSTNELSQVNLRRLSSGATQVLNELRRTSSELDRLLKNLNEASLNQSLENIRRASQDLDEAVRNFRRYPAGVLFGKPPPPAASVEPPK